MSSSGNTTFTYNGLETTYPNYLLMTTEDIHSSLLNTSYRSGFPGMNGRSWSRIGTFYHLVSLYMTKTAENFKKHLQEKGLATEEDSLICYQALSVKFEKL